MSIAAVTVNTSATVIVAENFHRIGLWIDNRGPEIVYWGDGSGVTTSNGIVLLPMERVVMDFEGGKNFAFFFRGAIYGIVASGSSDVRVLELVETR